jgi:polyisoprenoid-binding protein YceI
MSFQQGALMNPLSTFKPSIKRLSVLAALSATLLGAGSAWAAPLSYQVDDTHTFARFSYSHLGLSTQLSSFSKTRGTVVFDAEAKTGSVDITIDTKSVQTGSDLFNEHIQGEDFLDTARFPTATFKSTKVVFEGDKPSQIEGTLTIKGVSQPVTLQVSSFLAMAHPMRKKPALGANASTTIKRSAFNAGKYVPFVGDEVRIDVAIEALAP